MVITPEFKALFNQSINAMLAESALSTKCIISYENTKKIMCPNCKIDPITKRSSSIPSDTAEVPFLYGQVCPVCMGDGFLFDKYQEEVNLLVVYDSKYWLSYGGDIHAAQGKIQTIAPMGLITKLRNANRLMVDSNLEGLTRNLYSRDSDPEPAGLGSNDYVFTFWKKI